MNEITEKIFPHDGVFEIILGSSGVRPNLSPIGVRRRGEELTIKVYNGTLTLSNLRINPKCTINVTSDPTHFFLSLSGSLKSQPETSGIPYIPDATVLTASCMEAGGEDPVSFTLTLETPITVSMPTAFSRGDSLFIDLLVHVTRLNIMDDNSLRSILPILRYELSTASRLSPSILQFISEKEKEISEVVRRKGWET